MPDCHSRLGTPDVGTVSVVSLRSERSASAASTAKPLVGTRQVLTAKFTPTQEQLLSRYGVRPRHEPRRSRSAGQLAGPPAQRHEPPRAPRTPIARSLSLAELQCITRPSSSAESEAAAISPNSTSMPLTLRRQSPSHFPGARSSVSKACRGDADEQGAETCGDEACAFDSDEQDDAHTYLDIEARSRGARTRRKARQASSFEKNKEEEARKRRERKRLLDDSSYMNRRTADIRQQAVHEKVVLVSKGSDYLHDARVYFGPYSLRLHLGKHKKEAQVHEDDPSTPKLLRTQTAGVT